MDGSRDIQTSLDVERFIKPKIKDPLAEAEQAAQAKTKVKKKPAPAFQATVDYREQGKDLNLRWFFLCIAILGLIFFAVAYWVKMPDEQIIHQAPHLKRRPAVAKTVDRNVQGYKVAY